MKQISLFILFLFFAVEVYAQNIPNYIPSNGLVGWWPFNGNANDESGNGNNLINNGASLSSDRNGLPNKCYSFTGQAADGITGTYMTFPNIGINTMNEFSISIWVNQQSVLGDGESYIAFGDNGSSIEISRNGYNLQTGAGLLRYNYGNLQGIISTSNIQNQWVMYTMVRSNNVLSTYINDSLISTLTNITPVSITNNGNYLARHTWGPGVNQTSTRFNGKLDDIAIYNRALTQQEITAIYNSQTCSASITPAGPTNLCSGQSLTLTASGSSGLQSCTSSGLPSNLQNGLVGYWPFCGNANDASGNGNNGTVNGATLTSDRFGNSNSAYSFNGTSDFIEILDNNILDFTSQFSISVWVNIPDYSLNTNTSLGERAILGKQRATTGTGYTLESISQIYPGRYVFGINNNISNIGVVSNDSLQLSTWENVTAVYDGILLKLFKNAYLQNSVPFSQSLVASSQSLFFGKEGLLNRFFKGKIDDIAIYNRALSTAEIQQLYGLGSTQYLWSTGATNPSISVSPTQTTTYTVTVTENGQTCTASSTVNVSTPTATISANGPTSFCTGGSVTLTANSGSSYLWSNGATSQSITVNQAGSYSVTVTSNGCSATSSPTVVTITQTANPTVSANGPITFCNGGSVTLNSSTGSSYLWSNGATSQSITVNQSGTYSVTTNTNGCSGSSAPITVTVNQPPLASISSSGPTTFCQGSSVALNANTGAGLTYQWQLNGNNIAGASAASYTANAAGSYTVVVTNSNGCSATSSATSVTVSASPTVSITPSGPTTFCAGGSVTLSASGASTYQWSNGSNSSSITVSQSGNYTVTGFSNGCSGNASPVGVTVFNNPSISAGGLPPYTNVNASPLSLTANPSGGVFSGFGVNGNQFNPSQAGLGTATVFYSYTDGNGCSNSTFQQTIVYDTLSQACSTFDTLYINTVITGAIAPNNTSTITIYPNPANTDLVIHNGNFGIMGAYSVRITNTLGQTVFLSQVNQQQFVIALTTLGGAGTYYFALLDGQGNVVETKVIVVQ